MAHLSLDAKVIQECRDLAKKIAIPVEALIQTHTTVAIERATLRLLGVNGALQETGGQWFPLVNLIVESLRREKVLGQGGLYWFVNGMIQTKLSPEDLAMASVAQKVNLCTLPQAPIDEVRQLSKALCVKSVK